MSKQQDPFEPDPREAKDAGARLASEMATREPATTADRYYISSRFADVKKIVDRVPWPAEKDEFRISVRRPQDLLVFDLVFVGLEFAANPPRLERQAASAYIVVEFPPQSFGEQAFFEVAEEEDYNPVTNEKIEVTSHPGYPPKNVPGGDEEVPKNLPSAHIRMSGRSRIAVTMPNGETTIPYDLASMLAALRNWPMRLDGNAVADRPQLGGIYLVDVVAMPIWTSVKARYFSAIDALLGGRRTDGNVVSALEATATRLAKRAATSLAQRTTEDLNAALEQEMRLDLVRLGQQFPALQTAQGQALGIAAISAVAIESLAGMVEWPELKGPIADIVPFIPFLLGPHEPSPGVTALELPYRLILSPLAPARWLHQTDPVEHHGRTELWHTRLSTAEDDIGADQPSRVRALWSPDYRPQGQLDELIKIISLPVEPPETPQPNPNLLRMGLDPVDRSMLVTLMSGFDATRNGAAYNPVSSEAKRLHLSALGALLECEGNWTRLPDDVDLQQWRHISTLGRDQYVRVMYAGYLCPTGHSASLVKVTERKFESLGGRGNRVAVLRQRFFLVVREPVRDLNSSIHQYHGNNFPFTQIEIKTRVASGLMEPGMGASALAGITYDTIQPRMLFWPMVPAGNADGMVDFHFDMVGINQFGERKPITMPLLFVGKLAEVKKLDELKTAYNNALPEKKRTSAMGGRIVTFAPPFAGDKGDSRLPTVDITLRVGNVVNSTLPRFYPEIESAHVGVKVFQKLLGQPNFIAQVTYPDVYRDHAYDGGGNPGQLFLQLVNSKPLAFGSAPGQPKSDTLGAIASPQMNLLGLSRVMGPVAGKSAIGKDQVKNALNTINQGAFNPLDFFDGAKILGGVSLGDILALVPDLANAAVPKMVARDMPDWVEASFEWDTVISKQDALKLLIPNADQNKPATRLTMNGLVLTPINPALTATFEAAATLNNFKINLFGFIILWFEQLAFRARSGQKPDVLVELREGDEAVQFGGPLEFVNEIRKFIPSNGFSDPPSLSVTPSGISASYSLNLPAIQVGVFALSNASLGAGFNLPFDSKPASVRFNFSERQSPFSLTVSLLGGGGFFAIGISARGVQEIEAAIEFGAAIAIDLGVASGGVEVKAGIYFHWLEPLPNQGSVELAGYVRLHGELTVLGIISASLTFNLQLGYQKNPGSSVVYGEATLTVEIEILFFSASVSVKCRREFQGGEADPKFIDLVPDEDVWAEYCDAFAKEAA